MPYQKINKKADEQLTAISNKRKANHAYIKTKQDITAEAIDLLYKKEKRNGGLK